jgi:hypothetical protein
MGTCVTCNTENPAGSKFCAGCGAALPKTPVDIRCASCGAESPEGSRFCKGCGRAIGAASVTVGQNLNTGRPPIPPGGGAVRAQPKAPSQTMQRVKMLLGGGAALYALGIFLMYSELAKIKAAYGPYASQVPGTGLQWFLIVVDAVLACLNVYAISLIAKGDHKYAKWLFVAMSVLGAIFLLRGLSGPVIYILINVGLLVGGIWGWILISHEDKALPV